MKNIHKEVREAILNEAREAYKNAQIMEDRAYFDIGTVEAVRDAKELVRLAEKQLEVANDLHLQLRKVQVYERVREMEARLVDDYWLRYEVTGRF